MKEETKEMEKAKLGISVGLLAALVYISAYLGMTPLVLVAGYVLLMEQNEWLKKAAVRAIVIELVFTVAVALLGLLSNFVSIVNIGYWMSTSMYNSVLNSLNTILVVAEKLILVILALKALTMKEIKIGKLEETVEKHM